MPDVTVSSAVDTFMIQGTQALLRTTGLGLGSAALLTAGTGANNAVQLDGSSKLPAVDGSQLTNLPSVTIPGSAMQVLTSDGAGGVTATGVTIDAGNNVTASGFGLVPTGLLFWQSQIIVRSPSNGVLNFFDSGNVNRASIGVGLVDSTISDAATNTIVTALTLSHATSATAAAGLGVAEVFQLESAAGTMRTAGQISTAWTSAVDGAESSVVTIQPMRGGSLASGLSIGPTTLAYDGGSVTGSSTTSFASIAGTWNTSGSPTAVQVNITATAFGAAALLMDLQTGGTSTFNVSPISSGVMAMTLGSASPQIVMGDGTGGSAKLNFNNSVSQGYALNGANGGLTISNNNNTNPFLILPSSSGATLTPAGASVIIGTGKGFQLGNNATTGLTAGVLAALTNATVVIIDGSGQAYRVPCII